MPHFWKTNKDNTSTLYINGKPYGKVGAFTIGPITRKAAWPMKMKIPSKEKLISLQKILKTDGAIGRHYCISRQAVFMWRKKYGIKSLRELMEARNYQIKKLYQAGLTTKELVKKFEISNSTICRITKPSKNK
jgi:DNA-directed RNA polymerase specialized sigma subunit